MPVYPVKGGYKYGKRGTVYKQRWRAVRQGKAIKASQRKRRRRKRSGY